MVMYDYSRVEEHISEEQTMVSTSTTGAGAGRSAGAASAAAVSTGSVGGPALRVFLYWLPVALIITVLSGLVYVAVQQNFRQSANDPQIQMAEDAAAALEAGAQPQAVVGTGKVDMARSLAPFLIVYDDQGQPLAASVQLNGQIPTV